MHVYNLDEEQTSRQAIGYNATARYEVLVRNDGNAPDAFQLTAAGNAPGWTVVYYAMPGEQDITAAITGGGWQTPVLAARGWLLLKVAVTPDANVPLDSALPLTLTATSKHDPARADSVVAATTCAEAPLTAVRLAVTPPEGGTVDTPMTMTATPVGGRLVEYCFFIGDGNGWRLIRPYALEATCQWTSAEPGDYALLVWAREVNSDKQFEVNATIWKYTITPHLSSVVLSVTPNKSARVNQPLVVTATAHGGKTLEYCFYAKHAEGWELVQPYGPSNTCVWVPIHAGRHTLLVWAREAGTTETWQVKASTLPVSIE
jgi:hypothetical protein